MSARKGERVGTAGKQARALAQLVWLRDNRPEAYDRIMVAVAEIVSVARGEGKSKARRRTS